MGADAAAPKAGTGVKERALRELKTFWMIVLYLWLFFGSFTVYRRLILAETGVPYLHYGIALIEALVIAKVILIGRLFGFTRRFEDKPLYIPVLYKSMLFGILVMLFGVVERLVEGWFRKEDLVAILHNIAAIGVNEMAARVLILIVAFVPFFAFWEMGRVIGMARMSAMFFSKKDTNAVVTSSGEPS